MRLDEIDKKDRTYAASAGIDLNIDSIYADTKSILEILLTSKSPARTAHYMSAILLAEEKLNKVLNANFKKDKSTKLLKDKAQHYLNEIQNLKNQL